MLVVVFAILCLLPACSSPTVAYFPVRQVPGPDMLSLSSGKLVLEDGCIRLEWPGSSDLLIWPYGYTYRISGSEVEILDENGALVARTGQYKQLGGGEIPSVSLLTGFPPPPNCPGPYWLVGQGSIKNLYLWDLGAGPGLIAIMVLILITATVITWLIMHRRTNR